MKAFHSKIIFFLMLLLISISCDELDILNNVKDKDPDEEEKEIINVVEYGEIVIGDQIWMDENLNFGIMIDAGLEPTHNGIIEKYCYNNDTSLCNIYGGLYTWNELMNYRTSEGNQGICPDGWHIPSKAEWETLIMSLGGNNYTGGRLKEVGTDHWSEPNIIFEPGTEFNALPSGYYDPSGLGSFLGLSYQTYISSSTTETNISFSVLLQNSETTITIVGNSRTAAFSVRCIKD